MKQFEIFVNNRSGELARVTEALAANGINILAIASERSVRPLIRIVTNDEQSTRTALSRADFKFEEQQLMVVELTDRPGELAKVARKLANQGVNVESIHILSKTKKMTTLALVIDNWKKAEKALS